MQLSKIALWPLKQHLAVQVLGAIFLGLLTGLWTSQTPETIAEPIGAFLGFVGNLFLNALKMLIVPLVTSSVVSAVISLSNSSTESLGRLGLRTLSFYAVTSTLAIITGLLWVNLLGPGRGGDGSNVATTLGLKTEMDMATFEEHHITEMAHILEQFFPANIVDAAANGQLLGLIVFCLLFGIFSGSLSPEQQQFQRQFWDSAAKIMMKITEWVMKFAPIGAFALVAHVVSETGLASLKPLSGFAITVILALSSHMLITMPLLLFFVGRVSPVQHYRAMLPVMAMAFSTSSSSATLPLTMECVERDSGVSKDIAGFVLPIGATVNMDGTALYECVAALFLAQAYGIDLSMTTQALVVAIALFSSIGVAGVPAASLVAISIILTSIGLPIEGIAALLVVDRLLDMLRTTTNVFGDSCCAVIIARQEGERTRIGLNHKTSRNYSP